MNLEQIMQLVLFFITLGGAGWGIWWKIDAKVDKVKTDAAEKNDELRSDLQEAKDELAAHKLHTAEKYVAKDSLKEMNEQIMGAISGVKTAIDNMTLRVDRVVENQSKPARAPRSS